MYARSHETPLTRCPFDATRHCPKLEADLEIACLSYNTGQDIKSHESDGSMSRVAHLMVSAAAYAKAHPCTESCATIAAAPADIIPLPPVPSMASANLTAL